MRVVAPGDEQRGGPHLTRALGDDVRRAARLRAVAGNVTIRQLQKRDMRREKAKLLMSLYRTNELPFHLKKALENGVTRDEIIATITHLAFYAGWPPAMTAMQVARKAFEESRE